MTALHKALCTASRALTDSSAKDIIKQMKAALLDKALPIQRAAADVFLHVPGVVILLISL